MKRHYYLLFLIFLLVIKNSFATTITWRGSSGNTNWNVASNWSPATVPTSTDDAIFDGTSTFNCTINAAVTVLSLKLNSGFVNTITQGNFAVTVGANGFIIAAGTFTQSATTVGNTIINGPFTQSGGIFTGSTTATVTTTVNGAFSLTLGTFTCPAGTLFVNGNFTYAAGVFNRGTGTITFTGTAQTIDGGVGPVAFQNVTFNPTGNATHIIKNAFQIMGTLTLAGGTNSLTFNSGGVGLGEIQAKAALVFSNTSTTGGGGSATLNICGAVAQSVPNSSTRLPNIKIASTNTVTLPNAGSMTVVGGWKHVSGTVIVTGSTVNFVGTSGTIDGGASAISFQNVTFNPIATSIYTIENAFQVLGTLTLAGGVNSLTFNQGVVAPFEIQARGTLVFSNTSATGGGGSATLNICGAVAQSVPNSSTRLPNIKIASTNTVTLPNAGSMTVIGGWTYVSGTVVVTASTVIFAGTSGTIDGGASAMAFQNVTFNPSGNAIYIISNAFQVLGTLTLSGGVNSLTFNKLSGVGEIQAKGTLVFSNTSSAGGGTAVLSICGTVAQSVPSSPAIGQCALPNVKIASTSTVTLANTGTITVTGSWTYVSGTVVVTGSTVILTGTNTSSQITSGTMSFNKIQISGPVAIASNLTLASDLTINASGSLTVLSTFQINIAGNWTNSGTFTSGTGLVTFNGLIQTIDNNATGNFNQVTFNPTGGSGTVTINGNAIVNGTLILNGGGNSLTLNAGTLPGELQSKGAITLSNLASGGGGNATLNINGTIPQVISSGTLVAGQCPLPNLKISNTVTLPSILTMKGNWTYVSGTVTVTGSTVIFLGTSETIDAGTTMPFQNVTFSPAVNSTYTISNSCKVNGTLTLSGAGGLILNGTGLGEIQTKGAISLTNTSTAGGGNATLNINGTSAQVISSAVAAGLCVLPNINIANAVTLPSTNTMSVKGNWTYQSGAVTSTGSTVVFVGTSSTIDGGVSPMTFQNVTFNPSSVAIFTISNIVKVASVLTLSGAANSLTFNAGIGLGEIQAQGAISLTNTATTGGGNATLNINGSANQTISSTPSPLSANMCTLPNVKINTSTSAIIVTLPAFMTVAGNWNNLVGTLSIPAASTILFTGKTGAGAIPVTSTAIIGTAANYQNINFSPSLTSTFVISNILNVAATLTLGGVGSLTLNGGEIQAKAGISLTNTAIGGGGNTLLTINGGGTQTISSIPTTLAPNVCTLPSVKINSGTVTFPNAITVGGNWTYIAGTFGGGSFGLPVGNTVYFSGGTVVSPVTIDAGNAPNMNFRDVNIRGIVTLARALNVLGNLTIDGGTLDPTATLWNISVFGSWFNINSGTFTPRLGTVFFSGTTGGTLNNGSSSFYNVSFGQTGTGTTLASNIIIGGDMTISGILNASTFQINLTGNWTNNATFSAGTGKVVFNGTAVTDQTINGTASTAFYNLEINKTSSGLTLNKDVSITHQLLLTSGIVYSRNISTGIVNNLVLTAGSSYSGGSSGSFVSGPVQKVGNTAFIFPTGKGQVYAPIGNTNPASLTTSFTMEYFNVIPPSNTSLSAPLLDVSNCEYWNVSSNASDAVQIKLFWSNPCSLINYNVIAVAHFSGSQWVSEGAIGITDVTSSGNPVGNMTSAFQVTSYGNFTYGHRSKLTINTAGVVPEDYYITGGADERNPFVARSGSSGTDFSFVPSGGIAFVHPTLPPSGVTNVFLYITPGTNSEAMYLRIDVDPNSNVTKVNAQMDGVYYEMSPDYYTITGANKIVTFFNDKPQTSLNVTTNLQNGIDYSIGQTPLFIATAPGFTNAVNKLRIINPGNPAAPYYYGNPLQWDGKYLGTQVAFGVYQFQLELVSGANTYTYNGQLNFKP